MRETTFWLENVKERDYSEDLGIDGKIILEWILGKHCQTSTLRTRTEMVFETLVCSPLNHLTPLIDRENFIILSHRESNKSNCYEMLPRASELVGSCVHGNGPSGTIKGGEFFD
jgi:hypothetical protein